MVGLDIVIPVYNEGRNIVLALEALRGNVHTPYRVLICYDREDDDTLTAIARYDAGGIEIRRVRNPGRGPHSAVVAGLRASSAPAVLVYMADDDYNAGIVDEMVARFRAGADVVAASRFMPGGSMVGCRPFKALVARLGTSALRHVAGLPVHDGTNAFRLFSRRVIDTVEIESSTGFTFSIELLAKTVRLGWKVDEVPAQWFERGDKPSRFRIFRWLPAYLDWLAYATATRWLPIGPRSVRRRPAPPVAAAREMSVLDRDPV